MAKNPRKRVKQPSRPLDSPQSDVENNEVGNAQEPLDDQQRAELEDIDAGDGHEAPDKNQEAHGNDNSAFEMASWANPIDGASIFPTIRNRLPTATEWEHVKAYIISNEEDVLLHEEKCRVCYQPLESDTLEGLRHYREHNVKLSCPYCHQNWTGKDTEAQRHHLQEDHSDNIHPSEPRICPYSGCTVDLAHRAPFPSLAEVTRHMREHINYSERDAFCQYPGCHANIGHMSDQMRGEHEGMHKQSPPEESLTQKKGKKGSKHTQGTQTIAARAGLYSQDSANAKQPAAGPLGAGVDNTTQTEQTNAPHVPNQSKGRQLIYCTICWTAQGHKSATAQEKHARACKTRVKDFISLNQTDASRERANRKKGKTKTPEKDLTEVSNSSAEQTAVAANFIAKVRQTPATDAEVLAQDPPRGSPVETPKDKRTKKPEPAAAAEEPDTQSRKTRSKGTKQAKPAAAVEITESAEEPPAQEIRRKRAKNATGAATVGGTQSDRAQTAPKTRIKRVKESAAADIAASAQQPPSQRGRRGRRNSSNAPAENGEDAEGSASPTADVAGESPRAQSVRNRAAPDPLAFEAPAPSKPKLRLTHKAARPRRK